MPHHDHTRRDRDLGMDRPITRRDFLNGIAIGIGGTLAGAALPGLDAMAAAIAQAAQDAPDYYPPALTGMRGSHDGSFEVAHALRDGTFWAAAPAAIPTDDPYDLVIVGGGISGLAAAYCFRARTSPSARILILDNHDDFGGHAKRNEFRPRGRLLVANGGTWAIESPFPYSAEARGLMTGLGIDPPALAARAYDRDLYRSLGLQSAVFFDRETFGEDRLVKGVPSGQDPQAWRAFLAATPLAEAVRADIARIESAEVDYLPGLSSAEKKDRLSRISYRDFLLQIVKAGEGVLPYYQTRTHGLYGVGIEAVSALEGWAIGLPGYQGLKLEPGSAPRMSYTARGEAEEHEDYTFHFPDGNATIARLLVRALIPDAVPGRSVDDVVTSRVDYGRLDRRGSPVRIRLNSTAARVRHATAKDSGDVEVTYARDNRVHTVTGKRCVLACWNQVIPYLCPELPDRQKEALRYGVKVPLVYTTVAVRDWHPFVKLGIRRVRTPGLYHTGVNLDEAVNIGEYRSPKTPDEPILLRMTRTPCRPGLPARSQHRAGHLELLKTPFSTFERRIRDELARMLGRGGFDPARDIDAITVNRWPHGYAYEYNPLWDPEWPEDEQPCVIARQRFGRIAIANSDAAAAAYTDAAIDQAYRAVNELLTAS